MIKVVSGQKRGDQAEIITLTLDLKLQQINIGSEYRDNTDLHPHRLSTVRESRKIPRSQVSCILRYADGTAALEQHVSIR